MKRLTEIVLLGVLMGAWVQPQVLTAAPAPAGSDRLSVLEQKIAKLKDTQKKVMEQHMALKKEIASLRVWIHRNA